jgi:hypothetical protein
MRTKATTSYVDKGERFQFSLCVYFVINKPAVKQQIMPQKAEFIGGSAMFQASIHKHDTKGSYYLLKAETVRLVIVLSYIHQQGIRKII